MAEDLGGQDVSADEAYLAGVHWSYVYVGVFAERYGVRLPSGYSATEAEFLRSRSGRYTYRDFRPRLRRYKHGRRPARLGLQRTQPLHDEQFHGASRAAAAHRAAPERDRDGGPHSMGPARPRRRAARELTTDGPTITVAAEVRSGPVHVELTKYRDRATGNLPFVSPAEAKAVQVTGLSSSTQSTQAHLERMTLRDQTQRNSSMRMTFNGIGPDEYARRALSDALSAPTSWRTFTSA